MADGRLDEARAAFEKAEALNPLDFFVRVGRRTVAMLQHRWADAEAVNQELAKVPSPIQQFISLNGAAQLSSVRGRSEEALAGWDAAVRLPGIAPQNRTVARNRQAAMLLRLGKPTAALAQLQPGLADARNRDAEFEMLQLLAVAQAALGQTADSEKSLALLESRAAILPGDREKRRLHWARGQIALNRGDTTTAGAELNAALRMLPVHGPVLGPPSSHADLLFAAAWATVKAGQDADAATMLERLQKSHDRVFGMESYARSFYVLAQIYERRGNAVRAREQYSRFLDLWRDGDMERGWVADAQKKTAR